MRVTALASIACVLVPSLAHADGIDRAAQARRGAERLDVSSYDLRLGAVVQRRRGRQGRSFSVEEMLIEVLEDLGLRAG